MEALAANGMLRRRGLECALRFGVDPKSITNPTLAAHAWVEVEGQVILGRIENLADYVALS